jgi:hypothetical protein
MNITTRLHLRRLLHAHRSFSGVAQALGIDTRAFRRQRNAADTPKDIRRAIANAARSLFLRFILQELRRSGAVTRAQLRAAAVAARTRLETPGKGNKRALQQLAAKEGGRPSKGPAKKTRAKRGDADQSEQTRLPGT